MLLRNISNEYQKNLPVQEECVWLLNGAGTKYVWDVLWR